MRAAYTMFLPCLICSALEGLARPPSQAASHPVRPTTVRATTAIWGPPFTAVRTAAPRSIPFPTIRQNLRGVGMENTVCANAGSATIARKIAPPRAKVLVKARGLNNFPSAPSSAKTGRKLTIVVRTAATIAEATSVAPLYTVVNKSSPSGRFSMRCTILSDRTIPTSTMVPMAMAIPESATIFASTPA